MNKSIKILHLEDTASDADLVARELRKHKIEFEHLIIDSEHEYLDALNSFQPDIILCDHSLPAFNSLEALRIVKSNEKKIPFILITATMSEEVAASVVNEGADDYILKDRLKRLPYAVLNTLDKYEYRQERKDLVEELRNREKIARDALVELANKLSLATKASGVGVWDYIIDKDEAVWDQQMFDIYGINDHKTVINFRYWKNTLPLKGRTLLIDEIKNAIQNKSHYSREFQIRRPDGEIRYILGNAIIEKDINGLPYRMIGTNQDITETKAKEKKIKATAEELEIALSTVKKIMDSSLDVICSTDQEGYFVNVSAASKKMWGYEPDELIGRNYTEFLIEEDIYELQAMADKIMQGAQVTASESRFVHKSGKIIQTLWSAKFDEETNRTFSVVKDVTEKKQLELQTKEERDRFYDMFSQAPASVGAFSGPQHVYQMANKNYLKLTGRENIIGKTVREVFPEIENQGLFELLDNVYKTGTPFFAKERLIEVDIKGKLKEVYLNFIYQPFFNIKNEVEGIFFFAIDVTEQVLLRKEIEKREARYRALIENNYGVILLRNEKMEIIYRSPYGEKLLGYTDEERIGNVFSEIVHPDDLPAIKKHEQKVLANPDQSFSLSFRLYHKNGTIIWVEEIATNLLADPNVNAIVSNFRDITDRKNLEEQQALLASIVNHSDDAIISYSVSGEITSWNKGAEKLHMGKSDEIIGKKMYDLAPPYKREECIEILETIKKGAHIEYYETERIRKDGSIVEVSLTLSPIYNNDKKIIGISEIARDITEIKKSQEIIKKSERQYREMMENLPVATYTCDVEGKILLYNNAAAVLWGRRPRIGKDKWCGSWKIFNTKNESISLNECPMAVTLRTGKPVRNEEIIIERPDGTKRNVIPHPIPLYGSSGLAGALNVLTDITEIREYENALKQSENQYKQIVETAQEGIWLLNDKNKTAFVNTKLCDILEYAREELIGMSVSELLDNPYTNDSLPWFTGKEAIHQTDYKFVSKSGKVIWANISANKFYDDQGIYKGSLAMVTDITDKVSLQKKLVDEQIHKQKDITRAAIKAQENERSEIGKELHDNVNQLLAASKLYLNHSLSQPDEYQTFVSKGGTYISLAIEEIRKLTKALVGPSTHQNIGLISSVESLIEDISIVHKVNIKFTYQEFEEDRASEDLKLVIFRIIQEQLTNIFKHAEASAISIDIRHKENNINLSIGDNGKGFDSGKKRKGIGLSNIYNRASIYNGKVNITTAPGNGCTLTVDFELNN